MQLKPVQSALLSLLVPGMGQICSGKSARGAAILIAVIVVGNLNAVWLSLHAMANTAPFAFWSHTLPRFLHDLFAAYGVIFLLWQIYDAYQQAKLNYPVPGYKNG